MFADDLILFCKTPSPSLKIMMEAFQQFTLCLGLRANMEKSSIVFGGDYTHTQNDCLDITGFTEGHCQQIFKRRMQGLG